MRIMSNTALFQINDIDETVLLDRLSIAIRKSEGLIRRDTVSQEDVSGEEKSGAEFSSNILLMPHNLHDVDKHVVDKKLNIM